MSRDVAGYASLAFSGPASGNRADQLRDPIATRGGCRRARRGYLRPDGSAIGSASQLGIDSASAATTTVREVLSVTEWPSHSTGPLYPTNRSERAVIREM
jgi:hypothetical protein